MTDYEMILTERRGDVLGITLNRPERLNAAPPQMFDEIRDALDALGDARAVLLLGAGRGFCSGADVGASAARDGEPGDATSKALSDHYHPTIQAIADLPVPVVSAVQGAAAGIGCSLALAADFCIAGESAYFLQAFVNIGLVADGGASWMLPRLIGRGRAMEMLLLGERIKAERALEWGLAYRLVPNDVLENEAWMFADRLARGPTVAMGLMRQQVAYGMSHSLAETMEREAENQRAARRTADATEGGAAFLQKRDAEFKGA